MAFAELRETPDRVCQQIGLCTNTTCHLYPLPKHKYVPTPEEQYKLDRTLGELRAKYVVSPLVVGCSLALSRSLARVHAIQPRQRHHHREDHRDPRQRLQQPRAAQGL